MVLAQAAGHHPAVSRRSRVLSFGGAAALVVAGIVCAVVIAGGAGQLLALVLIGLGLVVAVSLVFYEVGLSEDRERARTEAAAPSTRPSRGSVPPRAGRRLAPVKRLDRSRGRRRRLH
jgi:hypothetical protein